MVEAGDSKDSGMTSAPPITMRTASVSPKARVMPRMTAVMREGIADFDHDVANGLPARISERERTLTIAIGHGAQGVHGKCGDRRQDHDGQHDGAGQDAHAGLRAEDGLAGGDDHVEADEAEHDGGNTHEQLDERLEDLLAEVRPNLECKIRRPDGDGQRDGGRQQRDRERRDDERQRPGLRHTVSRSMLQGSNRSR